MAVQTFFLFLLGKCWQFSSHHFVKISLILMKQSSENKQWKEIGVPGGSVPGLIIIQFTDERKLWGPPQVTHAD